MDAGLPSQQAPLKLRQAALRAGQGVMSFKAVADALNGTVMDLRLPGNRSTPRYDPERLQCWLRNQGESGDRQATSPVLVVRISASWDGRQWTVRDAGRSLSATGSRLTSARRSLATRIARLVRTSSDRIRFDVDFDGDLPAVRAWAEAEALKVLANRLLNESGRKRLDAVLGLMSEGMTAPEIAEVFGMSYQRIQQIVANAKTK